ncbi:glycerophosphodiester phosphodiesterase, putative [Entamoeba invadens IP1]|uniref:Glycerophosphodiester phosphodiesterase, putative n=2 Tax=Entamoeba invadens TaxID=33085 RepID=A0A0A1U5A5_ENTIV|nr:glycerophosphodiester phosphodiesterase, putative [Entamoeba invadens IP1]ELP89490.1 glycerophosphodiester phosphodiesterase, putative [Entamoeba invadens IP1]|eukprot:XP_004256261.1 glycerophosphodiester phosphodiesterase, putative [Entamoeba invadens IP1]
MGFCKTVLIITAILYISLFALNAIIPPRNAYSKHRVVYDEYPVLVAHRGGRGIYPENTLEAMRISYNRYHVDLLECDIQMSKDGHFVLLHDFWTNRTTNVNAQVQDLTLAELKKIDVGYYFTEDGVTFPMRGKNITFTTLEEMLDEFYQKPVKMSIELKDKKTESVDRLVEILSKYKDINKQVCIDCSNHPMQKYFRSKVGDFYCTENDEIEGIMMGLFGVLKLSRLYYFIQPNPVEYYFAPYKSMRGFDFLADELYKVLQNELDSPFMYFTVNNELEMARAIALNAKGIITDRPDIAFKVFNALKVRNITESYEKKYEHFNVPSKRTSWEFSTWYMKCLEWIGGNLPIVAILGIMISIPVGLLLIIFKVVITVVCFVGGAFTSKKRQSLTQANNNHRRAYAPKQKTKSE